MSLCLKRVLSSEAAFAHTIYLFLATTNDTDIHVVNFQHQSFNTVCLSVVNENIFSVSHVS